MDFQLLEVYDSFESNNKSKIKFQIKQDLGWKQYSYFPFYVDYVFVFNGDLVKNFDNYKVVIESIYSLQNSFDKQLVLFFEFNDKMNLLIKDENKIYLEKDISIDVGNLLIFYEKYKDTHKLYYHIDAHNVKSKIKELEDIYGDNSFFKEYSSAIDEDILEEFHIYSNIIDWHKILSNPIIKQILKYKTYIITLIVLLLTLFGIYQYYLYQQEQAAILAKKRALILYQKNHINFKLMTINHSKYELVKKILNTDFLYFDLKNKHYLIYKKLTNTALVKYLENTNSILNIGNNIYYVYKPLKIKKYHFKVKDISPLDPKKFAKYVITNGYLGAGTFFFNASLSKKDVLGLLKEFNNDNLWTYDVNIINNGNNNYVINLFGYYKKGLKK